MVSAENASVTVRSSWGYFTMPSCPCFFLGIWAAEIKQNVRTGYQGVIERPLPSSFSFACLARHRQHPHLGSITFVCALHWSNTPSRKIPSIFLPLFQMWSLSAPTRGQAHNHSRISGDNHCGATGKWTESKQRKCVHVCVCVCTSVLIYCTCLSHFSHVWVVFFFQYMCPCGCMFCLSTHVMMAAISSFSRKICWVQSNPEQLELLGNLGQMWSEDADVFIMISVFFHLWVMLSHPALPLSPFFLPLMRDEQDPWTICSILQPALPSLLHKSQLPGDSRERQRKLESDRAVWKKLLF